MDASNHLLKSFLDAAATGLVRNSRELCYLQANEAYARLMGKPVGEIVGRHLGDVMGQRALEKIRPHIEKVLAGERVEYETELPIAATGPKWIHVVYTPERDASGQVVAWVGSITDITKRKLAEETVSERERQLRFVTDHVPVFIVQCDAQARFRFVNAPYSRRFGLEPDQAVGRRIDEVIGAEAYEKLRPHVEAVLRGQRVEFEEALPYAYGTRWMHCVYVPQRDGAAVEGFVAVIQDVTARRNAEDALRDADRRKDEFLAILAHELRNPLAPLSNGLQILDLMSLAPETREARALMKRQLDHMVRLIDDLLDVSRITRGKIELKTRPISLEEAVRQGLEASQALVESRGHELSIHVPREPLVVRADLTRIAQVVANLVNNAAKYSPTGGRIQVFVERDGAHAVVRVTDTGIGIRSEMLERVFDLFTQADRGADGGGGLGIGLSIARGLIDQHGGSIKASSPGPGQGSEFTFRLPLADEADAPKEDSQESVPVIGARRVLVVDDNVDAASSLATLIRMAGSEVRIAHDGEQAVAAAREHRPDVVLLDIGLPKMDGYEVCRVMRGEFGSRPLIFAVTGWGQDQDRRRSAAAGFDGHLVKPADFARVAALLAGETRTAE
jgi:PAS domain S-box-containing protein